MAADSKASISDLLRLAKIVAAKLQLNDITVWLEYEMNGYPADNDAIPDYREIHGTIKGFNPYRGWIPVVGDDEVLNIAGTMKARQSATELEATISDSSKNSELSFRVSDAFRRQVEIATDVRAFFPKARVVGILEAVRIKVLDWALELEKRGIVGENMSFSSDEKTKAASAPRITNTFHGPATFTGVNMGQMSDQSKIEGETEIQGDVSPTIQNAIFEIKKNLKHIPASDQDEVSSQLEVIDEELGLPSPRNNRIKSAFQAILRIVRPIAEWTGKTVMEAAVEEGIKRLMLPPG
jgi:hypothetical protein